MPSQNAQGLPDSGGPRSPADGPLARLTRLAGRSLLASGACLYLREEWALRLYASWCMDAAVLRKYRPQLTAAVTTGKPCYLDRHGSQYPGHMRPGAVAMIASQPIVSETGLLLGCLAMVDDKPRALDDSFRRDLLEFAWLARRLLGPGAHRRLSHINGFHDRGQLYECLAVDVAYCRRNLLPISVVVASLAGNTREAGIPLLARVVRNKLLRTGEFAAWFDANKIVCVLPGADRADARHYLNLLRRHWATTTGSHHWTLACGSNTLQAGETRELRQVSSLLQRAFENRRILQASSGRRGPRSAA